MSDREDARTCGTRHDALHVEAAITRDGDPVFDVVGVDCPCLVAERELIGLAQLIVDAERQHPANVGLLLAGAVLFVAPLDEHGVGHLRSHANQSAVIVNPTPSPSGRTAVATSAYPFPSCPPVQ